MDEKELHIRELVNDLNYKNSEIELLNERIRELKEDNEFYKLIITNYSLGGRNNG